MRLFSMYAREAAALVGPGEVGRQFSANSMMIFNSSFTSRSSDRIKAEPPSAAPEI
jgi:hypothetical protein